MNKTTKGALAAGTAAVLLAGGAGTLAYWTDSQNVVGGSITSGQLKLGAPVCGSWVYDNGGATVVKFVPGDVVSKTCTFVITAQGDHLSAKVTAPNLVTTGTAPASAKANVTTAYTLGGTGGASGALADQGVITSSDDGKTLTAKFTVAIPFGTDETATTKVNANDTQNWTQALSTIAVKLTQTQTALNPTTP